MLKKCHLSDPYSVAPPLSRASRLLWLPLTHALVSPLFPTLHIHHDPGVCPCLTVYALYTGEQSTVSLFSFFPVRSIIRNILIYHDDDARSDGDVERHPRPGVWRHAGPHLQPSAEHRSARLPDGTPSSARCGRSETCRTMVSLGSTGTATLLPAPIFSNYGTALKRQFHLSFCIKHYSFKLSVDSRRMYSNGYLNSSSPSSVRN